jgi:hypothetical protein
MADETYAFRLTACRELMESHPESLVIAEQVTAIESGIPGSPGLVASTCRTVLETTCKTILKDRGQTPDPSWEAPKLLSETRKFLNFGILENGETDPKLRGAAEKLLRGVENILSGVIEIRNEYGTSAHGPDAYAHVLDERYVEIIARATDAAVGFLFKTHLKNSRHSTMARLRYGDNRDFDEWIDTDFGPFEVLETPLVASEALFRTDNNAYRSALVVFRQEQEAANTEVADDEFGEGAA